MVETPAARLRLDIVDNNDRTEENIRLRKIAERNNVNLSKLLVYFEIEGKVCILTEWIEGQTLLEISSAGKDTPDMYIEFGRVVGKLNSIKEGELVLANPDIRLSNVVVNSVGDIFLVDHEMLQLLRLEELWDYLARAMLWKKCMGGIKERVEAFLSGYSQFHDIKPVTEKMQWTETISLEKYKS